MVRDHFLQNFAVILDLQLYFRIENRILSVNPTPPPTVGEEILISDEFQLQLEL